VLSIVMVAEPESVPACVFVDVNEVTVPVTAYDEPGTAGMLACVFGVILTLKVAAEVVTGIGVPPEKFTVVDEGSVTAVK
jgi:hypothetical protein